MTKEQWYIAWSRCRLENGPDETDSRVFHCWLMQGCDSWADPRSPLLKRLVYEQWWRSEAVRILNQELAEYGPYRNEQCIVYAAQTIVERYKLLRERLYRHGRWLRECREARECAHFVKEAGRAPTRGERYGMRRGRFGWQDCV